MCQTLASDAVVSSHHTFDKACISPLPCRFAFGWVLVLMTLLVLGTKESARFNLVDGACRCFKRFLHNPNMLS